MRADWRCAPTRNITLNPIDRAQAGERLTVFQRVVEADGTPWLWAQSPRNQIGWARETSQGQTLVTKITPDLSGTSAPARRLNRRAKIRRPRRRRKTSSSPRATA